MAFVVTSPHPEALWEPIRSCLIRTKDAPVSLIIQESPGVLGSLCPEATQRPDASVPQKQVLGPARPQGEGIKLHLWGGRGIELCGAYVKTTAVDPGE